MQVVRYANELIRLYDIAKAGEDFQTGLKDFVQDLRDAYKGGQLVLHKHDIEKLNEKDLEKVKFFKEFKNLKEIQQTIIEAAPKTRTSRMMNEYDFQRPLKNTKKSRTHHLDYDVWENSTVGFRCYTNIQPMLNIFKGTGMNQRTGNIITIDSIQLKLTISSYNFRRWTSNSNPQDKEKGKTVRVSLILDLNVQPWEQWDEDASAIKGITDIYESEEPWAFKRVEYEKRFMTLYEEMFLLEPHNKNETIRAGKWAHIINKYIKLNFQSIYTERETETNWDCVKNNIYLCVTTNAEMLPEDSDEVRVNVQGYTRIRYHEPIHKDYEYLDD